MIRLEKKSDVNLTLAELDAAIADEEKAIAMYMKFAESSNSTIIYEMFHKIAEDEMKHLRLLKDLRDGMNGACLVKKRKA